MRCSRLAAVYIHKRRTNFAFCSSQAAVLVMLEFSITVICIRGTREQITLHTGASFMPSKSSFQSGAILGDVLYCISLSPDCCELRGVSLLTNYDFSNSFQVIPCLIPQNVRAFNCVETAGFRLHAEERAHQLVMESKSHLADLPWFCACSVFDPGSLKPQIRYMSW